MPTEEVDPRIAAVRGLFEAGDMAVRKIARDTGVPASTLRTWAKRYGWVRKAPGGEGTAAVIETLTPPSTERLPAVSFAPRPHRHKRRLNRGKVAPLLDRVYRLIQRNLEIMERRMSEDDSSNTTANPERDLRAVGALVRSVEKMKELEPDQSKREPVVAGRYPLTPEEEDRLRDEIVENLLRLRERRSDQGPQG